MGFFSFKTGTPDVAEAGLELAILLLSLPRAGITMQHQTWLFFFFLAIREFELRASHLLDRCSITRVTPPALFLNFLRDLYTVLHNRCTNLHSHQQREGSLLPTSSGQLSSLLFLITAIRIGARWYCTVVSDCTYLIIGDAGHFLQVLVGCSMSSLENCLFKSLVPVLFETKSHCVASNFPSSYLHLRRAGITGVCHRVQFLAYFSLRFCVILLWDFGVSCMFGVPGY
jgi:hypothetical protein